MRKVYIGPYNCISPLGCTLEDTWSAVLEGKSGITLQEPIGEIPNTYAAIIVRDELDSYFTAQLQDIKLAEAFRFTKLEKLMISALLPIVRNLDITTETELIISTTKGNIAQCDGKDKDGVAASLPALAQRIAYLFGFKRSPIVISNACVSGLQAISTAKRLIQMDYCKDAVIVASDLVSEFVLSGFRSFQALSDGICRPYDEDRKGLNLGEAAAALYISKQPIPGQKQQFYVAGEASINDANHISGPSRTGEGLKCSIERALAEAATLPEAVDFICAHGTATVYNDEMEAIALHRTKLADKPINSLKGYFGHTLGTAGLIETILSLECLRNNILLPSLGYQKQGTSLPLAVITEKIHKPLSRCLKTASGFAGTNTAILFEKEIL